MLTLHNSQDFHRLMLTFYVFVTSIVMIAQAQPQPLRSIFTDYLDSWTQFVNNTLERLPSQPSTREQQQCLHDLHFLVSSEATRQPWAIQMFDAMGKPTSGIMQESLSFLGLYSECINSESEHFSGQYCLAHVQLPESSIQQLQKLSGLSSNSWTNAQARIGLCFPSTCHVDQISEIGNFAISQLIANSSISLSSCYQRETEPLDAHDSMYFVVLALIGTFMLIVVVATLYELRLVRQMDQLPDLKMKAETGDHRVLNSPMADEDDTCSVCTQCSKCSSGRYPAIGYTSNATSSMQSKPSLAMQMMAANENNNFLSHSQNGWCACTNDMLQSVHVNNEEEIDGDDMDVNPTSKFANPLSQNQAKYSIEQHPDFRLIELLSKDLKSIESIVTKSAMITDSQICSNNNSNNLIGFESKHTINKSHVLQKPQSIVGQLLLCFSALSNTRRLLDVGTSSGEDSIQCLHGIKVICMLWIISGHSYSFAMQWLFFSNPNKIKQASTHLLSQVFANGTFSVDCFFFISGLLICLLGLKAMKANNNRLNVAFFYLHRYLRLTPLMLIVIAFSANIFRTIAEGPAWLESITMYDGWCRQNWWINALYLHNFINREQMCLSHSWYSAVDMQFYLISPLLLIPLARWPRIGLTMIGLLFTGSVTVTAVLTAINDYPAIPYIAGNVSQQVLNDYYGAIYIKPYCRIGPYLVGFLVGFLIFKKQNKIYVGPIKHVFLSILSIGTFLVVLFAMQGANNGIKPPILFAALYSALSRPLFCACLAYMIICFLSGKMSTLNAMLSLPLLRPFSRVSYAAYLLHPVIIAAFYGSREQVFYFSHYLMFYFIIGNMFITYSISFVASVCFEMPFINLSRMLLRGKRLK